MRLIFKSVNACRRFTHFADQLEEQMAIDESDQLLGSRQLAKIEEDFKKSFDLLLRMVSIFNKSLTASYLFQLILRLNYNEYYNK